MTNTKAIPHQYHTITAHLTIKNAAKAIEFYQNIFGGQVSDKMLWPDGKIMHAKIKIGDSFIMLHDEITGPEKGDSSPIALGGSPISLNLYVDDVDAVFNRAVEAGAKAVFPPTDMFWGDRWSRLTDPFGHRWDLATHIENVMPADMQKRQQEFCSQMACHK